MAEPAPPVAEIPEGSPRLQSQGQPSGLRILPQAPQQPLVLRDQPSVAGFRQRQIKAVVGRMIEPLTPAPGGRQQGRRWHQLGEQPWRQLGDAPELLLGDGARTPGLPAGVEQLHQHQVRRQQAIRRRPVEQPHRRRAGGHLHEPGKRHGGIHHPQV